MVQMRFDFILSIGLSKPAIRPPPPVTKVINCLLYTSTQCLEAVNGRSKVLRNEAITGGSKLAPRRQILRLIIHPYTMKLTVRPFHLDSSLFVAVASIGAKAHFALPAPRFPFTTAQLLLKLIFCLATRARQVTATEGKRAVKPSLDPPYRSLIRSVVSTSRV